MRNNTVNFKVGKSTAFRKTGLGLGAFILLFGILALIAYSFWVGTVFLVWNIIVANFAHVHTLTLGQALLAALACLIVASALRR